MTTSRPPSVPNSSVPEAAPSKSASPLPRAVAPSRRRAAPGSAKWTRTDPSKRDTRYAPHWDGIPGGPPDAFVLKRVVLSRELADGKAIFPDADADPDFFRAAPTRAFDDDDELAVHAPGDISFAVARRLAETSPAQVKLRWRPTDTSPLYAVDAALTALPGPPKLAAFATQIL